MPELPEVQTIVDVLASLVIDKKINKVNILHEKTVENDPVLFCSALQGSTIKSFSRVGKFIVFHFDTPYVVVSHLRMEGKYFLRKENEPYAKHDMVIFHFSDGTYLSYNDTRRFGILKLLPSDGYRQLEPLCRVGPDPFELKDASVLAKAFKHKNIAIKTALLDQSIMSGLGNIYVDEVCFATHVHPKTPAYLISSVKLEEILKVSKEILHSAIVAGGSTIKSYHPREGMSGNFQFALKAYGKQGKPCPNCGTIMRKIVVGGRGTTYCPKCQKNPASPFAIGLTGAVGAGKSTALNILKEMGYITYSSDEIVHELYASKSGQEMVGKIIPNLQIKDGQIDRVTLRDYLLDNPKKKSRLEKVVHKYVIDTLEQEIEKADCKQTVVIEVPLLFESGADALCDAVIYIDADEAVRSSRLEKRDGEYRKALKLNSSFNKADEKKATYVINNDGSVASLKDKLSKIISGMPKRR